MAFTRYLQVDQGGLGNHTTIGAAVTAAVAGGASSATPYLIEVGLGTFSENVSIPVGVHLRGQGQYASIINGTLDMKGGCTVEGFRISPTTADANSYGVRFALDTNGQFGVLNNVNVSVFGTNSGVVSALECEGTATGALLYVRNSILYAANRYLGDNSGSTSICTPVRIKSNYTMYCEVLGCHLKTSTSGGTSQPIGVLCDSVGGAGIYGYAHVVGDWEDVYGASGSTPAPILLRSLNATHPGALLDLGVLPGFSTVPPAIEMVYSGSVPPVYSRYINSLRYRTTLAREYGGDDYVVNPELILTAPPTAGQIADAPEGTQFIVAP